ncbi:MAG TPA: tripartite tricarboxylate transporter substrate binding protein [Burkholderiaceae bacterium]|nr:tripartite tricarboxylate transporter substrate binding protein [Burkholderiaceae bacterium]
MKTCAFTRSLSWAVLAVSILLSPQLARSQAKFPAGPVQIVVPFAPGAGADALARLLAPELSRIFGVPVVVENKPGAAGNIGTEYVIRSKPDGQTLLLSGIWVAVNRSIVKNMRTDPINQLAPVALMARQSLVLVVNPEVKAANVRDLLQLAKARPNFLTYAHAGAGNQPFLLAELLKMTTDTKITGIPFTGSGPALTAVIAGHVHMIFLGTSSTLAHIHSGKLRALAVTGRARSFLLPDVPTLSEAGLGAREFTNGSWWGISAPEGTPQPVIERLNAALREVAADPRFRERAMALGIEAQTSTPQEYDQLIRVEAATWQRLIKATGIEAE